MTSTRRRNARAALRPADAGAFMEARTTPTDETVDRFLGGAVRIVQKKRGYRFSVDAPLLAWFADRAPEGLALDLGTGCGILPVLLLHSRKCRRAVGLEIQEDLARLARRNAALNGFEDRFAVVRGDIREAADLFPGARFDMVVSNPPYRTAASGRRSPVREKEIARHEVLVSAPDVVRAGASCLRPGGRFFLIHAPSRLNEIAGLLAAERCPCAAVRWVRPRAGEPPGFVLLKAVRGGPEGEPAELPDLILHGESTKYTDEVESLLRSPWA